MTAEPTPPIELDAENATARLRCAVVPLTDAQVAELAAIAPTTVTHAARAQASRDWWPLALHWALDGSVGQLAAAVVRPDSSAQVSSVAAWCHAARIPLTVAAGRSGVCGASIPVFGGVVLDMTGLQGIVSVDDASLTIDVLPGTFGHELEAELRVRGYTLGHWPQSMELSTVGGWVACRGAGQYSTRYGKIEDMVSGLDVVLADGRSITTGGAPRSAVGPDLTQLFVGSEGTLGIITGTRLRVHPLPPAERRAAYAFGTFAAGIDACRRILRRGATPAVLRLYDPIESKRGHDGDGSTCVLLVLDEGEPTIIDGVMEIVAAECLDATRIHSELVERWLHHRNDTSALQGLSRKGFVVDTLEIAAPWSALGAIHSATTEAISAVEHCRAVSCHLSHSYTDGACLYFTFAATPPPDERENCYVAMWTAGTNAVLAAGGNLSHHHGVGLHRSRFMATALGDGIEVLAAVKQALDPNGILNPGKLGLTSPFGAVDWP